jgi:predicted RNase H-like nuclease (RuvC/YqgF family)
VEDGFELLEQKVRKAAELVRRLQGENKVLRNDLGQAQARFKEAERKLEGTEKRGSPSAEEGRQIDSLGRELKALRQERADLRARIAKLVEVLDGLD